MTLRRTFEDFCDLACRKYGDESQHIEALMAGLGITKDQVVMYINWTAGMTQDEIAEEFGIHRRSVQHELNKLQEIIPHIFNFDTSENMLQYQPKHHDKHVVHKF